MVDFINSMSQIYMLDCSVKELVGELRLHARAIIAIGDRSEGIPEKLAISTSSELSKITRRNYLFVDWGI